MEKYDYAIYDPVAPKNGMSLTLFHIVILLFGALSLVISQMDLPPEFEVVVGIWRRSMALLVGGLIFYHFVTAAMSRFQSHVRETSEKFKMRNPIDERSTMEDKKEKNDVVNPWRNQSAHPSAFLTTRDAKPRLFPFPLGKAGGQAKRGELWWEAGDTAHVGHFNQRDNLAEKEIVRAEMEDKEEERLARAKAKLDEYNDTRDKWVKRLANLKIVGVIIIVSLFSKKVAVLCLAMLIYYVFATELAGMLKMKKDEEDDPAQKRRKVPDGPGVSVTYLYEPNGKNSVVENSIVPIRTPSHRLMTSTDNRLAY